MGSDEDSPIHTLYECSKCLLPDSMKKSPNSAKSGKFEVYSKQGSDTSQVGVSLWVSKEDSVDSHCKCPDREGHDGSRRMASELKQLNKHKRASTMRSAHDT